MSIASLTGSPLIQSLSENKDMVKAYKPSAVSVYFDGFFHQLGGFNRTTDIDAGDFGRQVYALAPKVNAVPPLLPEAVSNAAQMFAYIHLRWPLCKG